jgi:hypothetical protein
LAFPEKPLSVRLRLQRLDIADNIADVINVSFVNTNEHQALSTITLTLVYIVGNGDKQCLPRVKKN